MKKFLTYLLYSLPVIFFVVCYFCMTVWGEDIIQGQAPVRIFGTILLGRFGTIRASRICTPGR